MPTVIHFGDLDELVGELSPGQVVRVAELDITESVNEHYGIRIASIGVHVRAVNADEHILSCYIPTGIMQLVRTPREPTDLDWDKYDGAWRRAHHLADELRAYLEEKQLDVRPGIIDLGDVRPLHGGWRSHTVGEKDNDDPG